MIDSNEQKAKRSVKAIQNRRVCFRCAFPISDSSIMICPRCKTEDIDVRRAMPKKTEPRKATSLPFPWDKLSLPQGGTVLLSGGPGSGKTTICIGANPTLYITTEQEIEQVGDNWYRLHDNLHAPLITNCYTWENLDEDLIGLDEDALVIVDSVSQFVSGPESADVVKQVIEKVRDAQARCIFIAQFRKDGVMLGPNELNHQVDVLATIPDDKTGMRRLAVTKNRFGGLFTNYFALDATGILPQDFNYAYTVEGSAGNYSLHLYPLGGAKMDGIFKTMVSHGIFIEGMASAAIECTGYRTGFAEPQDAVWRRSFAEDHGLLWIDPVTAKELIQKKLEEAGQTKENT